VYPILVHVARQYPAAVYYPFKILKQLLTPGQLDSLGDKLNRLIDMPSLDCFVESLQGLTHPEHRCTVLLCQPGSFQGCAILNFAT
jgi:hypothetical protein